MDEQYYTVDEVADRFKVTRAAVYKWMREGKLSYVFVGSDRRITGSALKAFVRPGYAEKREDKNNKPGVLMPVLAVVGY